MHIPIRALLPALAFIGSVIASPVATVDAVCDGQVTLAESYIGKDKNVKIEYATCKSTTPQPRSPSPGTALEARQTNVCGATCNTNCFVPAGGGPDPNECNVIADALRFDSQNVGALFAIDTGANNTIVLSYRSCTSFFVNQDFGALAYCRTDWADVLDFVATHCQAAQNAHGGNCVAADQRWFIQAQHS